MSDPLRELLSRRKDRTIATILNVKDECDEHLPPELSHALRKVVLDAMNDYYDVCLDVMRSLDGGEYVLNQDYIERRLDHIVGILEDGNV